MKFYGIMDYNKGDEGYDKFYPVGTYDFAEYLRKAKEYALTTFPKKEAGYVVKMLPALERGEISHIEIDRVSFRVSEVDA